MSARAKERDRVGYALVLADGPGRNLGVANGFIAFPAKNHAERTAPVAGRGFRRG